MLSTDLSLEHPRWKPWRLSLCLVLLSSTQIGDSCLELFYDSAVLELFLVTFSLMNCFVSLEGSAPPSGAFRGDMKIPVRGSVYCGPHTYGDFSWMIQQPEFAKTLFVFNDNEEQFYAFQNGDRSFGCLRGGGNAAIRPYQCRDVPLAVGIPTGSCGKGYEALNDRIREIIDQAVARVGALIKSGDYECVVFSQDPNKPTLGTGIFNPSDDVKHYIYTSLMALNSV